MNVDLHHHYKSSCNGDKCPVLKLPRTVRPQVWSQTVNPPTARSVAQEDPSIKGPSVLPIHSFFCAFRSTLLAKGIRSSTRTYPGQWAPHSLLNVPLPAPSGRELQYIALNPRW